jgi:hypothetical protein
VCQKILLMTLLIVTVASKSVFSQISADYVFAVYVEVFYHFFYRFRARLFVYILWDDNQFETIDKQHIVKNTSGWTLFQSV